MLPTINRLSKKNDFEGVFKNSKSSYDKILGVKMRANQQKITRFGIIVGLKVSKDAVGRNKIKRRIREIIRKQIGYIRPGLDIVLITLPAIKGKEFKEIEISIRQHFRNLRLY
jgi:ribonuclease P protein component